jgi:hypothetical protein
MLVRMGGLKESPVIGSRLLIVAGTTVLYTPSVLLTVSVSIDISIVGGCHLCKSTECGVALEFANRALPRVRAVRERRRVTQEQVRRVATWADRRRWEAINAEIA